MPSAVVKLLRAMAYAAVLMGSFVAIGLIVGLVSTSFQNPADFILGAFTSNWLYFASMWGLISLGVWLALLAGLGERR